MGIRGLPLEILTQICSQLKEQSRIHGEYLDHEVRDIASIRLVSREFAAAALPLLLEKVPFGQYNASLETLQAVSEHDVLRHYVRTVSCDDSLLAPIHRQDEAWKKAWRSCASQPDQGNQELMKDAQLRYKKIYDQRTKIIAGEKDLEMLNAALVKLPGLDSIEFSDRAIFDEYDDIFHKPFLRTISSFLDGKMPGPVPWTHELSETSLWDRTSTPYCAFVTVVRAFAMTEHRVRAISISGRDSGISHQIFSSAAPKDFDALCNLFQNLSYLQLDINTHGDDVMWKYGTKSQDALYRLLSTASSLNTLMLGSLWHIQDLQNNNEPALKVSNCFGSFKWSSLKSLTLEGWKILDDDLFDLLHRHRDTITLINFCYLHLQGGMWGQFLDRIRDTSAVIWTDFDCESLSDSEDTEYSANHSVITAFLRKEYKNPFTDYWNQPENRDDVDEDEDEDEGNNDGQDEFEEHEL